MNESLWSALIGGALVAIVGPVVLALIKRALPSRTETAEARADEANANASAAEQWQAWSTHQAQRITALEDRVSTLESALTAEREENGNLRVQNEIQSRLLRSVCRWALLLRDELLKAGGAVPPTPVDVEAALTSLDA